MSPNQQQAAAWNGPESVHYVDHADRYDRQLEPVTASLIARAGIRAGESVVDIGCGSGATALAVASDAGRVLGVDISEPLLGVARSRAEHAGLSRVEFVEADAQTHEFGEAVFDLAISQFGLMFFDDPIGAFANIRRALRPGGRIVFATWQPLASNGWLAPVADAVGRFADVPDLGGLANGGGMFQLKDPNDIGELLADAGFGDVAVSPLEPSLLIGGGGTLDETADFLFGMGIVRGLLSRLDEVQRADAVDRIRADLAARHEPGVGVRLPAGVWLVHASVPAS